MKTNKTRNEIQKPTAPQTWIKNGRNIFDRNTPAYLPPCFKTHEEYLNELYQLELMSK